MYLLELAPFPTVGFMSCPMVGVKSVACCIQSVIYCENTYCSPVTCIYVRILIFQSNPSVTPPIFPSISACISIKILSVNYCNFFQLLVENRFQANNGNVASPSPRYKNESANRINGFVALSALLVNNAHMPEVYMMLVHLLLGIRSPCCSSVSVSSLSMQFKSFACSMPKLMSTSNNKRISFCFSFLNDYLKYLIWRHFSCLGYHNAFFS